MKTLYMCLETTVHIGIDERALESVMVSGTITFLHIVSIYRVKGQ